jgi:hypothetical protein
MATSTITNPINPGPFLPSEVASSPARRNRLGGEWTGSDTSSGKLGDTSFRLSCFGLMGADQTLDAFKKRSAAGATSDQARGRG